MARASILTLLAGPACAALVACGASQSSDSPSSTSGAGGITPGSGGSSGTGGTQVSSGGTGLVGGGTAGTPSGGTPATGGASGGTTGGRGGAGAVGATAGGGGADAGSNAMGGASLGGAAGSAGSTGGGLPGIDTFTRVTIRSKSANLNEATGECASAAPGFQDDAVWSSWSLERATKTFTWEYCKGYPGTWESSGRVLSDVEVQGIVNSLTLITPSMEGGCIADGGGGELEIQADGTTAVYRPDSGWCGSGPNDQNYVHNMSPLWFWFETLTDPYVIPEVPETLTLYTGEIPEGPFPNPECSKNPLPIEYELAVATGTLSWRGMSSDRDAGGAITFCPTEMRVLEAQELDSVLRAYDMLTLGVSAPCNALERPDSLDQPNGQIPWMEIGIDALTDEVASCYGGSSRPYAIGVAELARVVADLTE